MKYDYSGDILMAKAMIDSYGKELIRVDASNEVYDPVTGQITKTETETTFIGVVLPYEDAQNGKNDKRRLDGLAYSQSSIIYSYDEIALNQTIEIGGDRFVVRLIEKLNPNQGQAILYKTIVTL
jgi:hypothetical protein